MNIDVKVNDHDVPALLRAETGCLKLELEPPGCPAGATVIAVDRAAVRASLTRQASVDSDRGLWWDGYAEALADVERAVAAGKPMLEWVSDVRRKFDLPAST